MPEDKTIKSNLEIDQALKEFEAKSDAEQTPQASSKAPDVTQKEVSDIKFETDSYKAVKFYNETNIPKMVQLVMKYSGGAIKEQKQAEYVLFAFAIIVFAISLFLFFGGSSGSPAFNKDIPPEVLPL